MWERFDEMFPSGGIWIEDQYIDKNYAIRNNVQCIGSRSLKPVRDMVENEMQFFWYPDGSFTAEYIYNIFSPDMPDNISALNVYGRKIYNDYMARVRR